jgi:hypothetical protein
MTATSPGPPIRTFSAAWRWFVFELSEMLAAPLEDVKNRQWGLALITLLLWPVGLLGLSAWFLRATIHVLRGGGKDESLDRMWAKFADAVTSSAIRRQPDGSEIQGPARLGRCPDPPAPR